tara:strand:- start:1658 stop:3610 length:1953 start_codon:yes stop_codon:yes gene_type:complete
MKLSRGCVVVFLVLQMLTCVCSASNREQYLNNNNIPTNSFRFSDITSSLGEQEADQVSTNTEQEQKFFDSVWKNNITLATNLLQQGVNPNSKDPSGWSPLALSCYYGFYDMVQLLCRHNADKQELATIVLANYDNLLLHTARQGYLDIVQWLLQENLCNSNDINLQTGETPLLVAINSRHNAIVEMLLRLPGIDVNKAAFNGTTPLVLAVMLHQIEIVKMLLQNKKILINKASNTFSPLYIATERGFADIVQLLLEYKNSDSKRMVDVNKPANDGTTPLYVAVAQGFTKIVQLLLEYQDSDNKRMVDINRIRPDGASPLYIACKENRYQIVALLLQQPGILVNASLQGGSTPLIIASLKGFVPIVRLLLAHPDIDINHAVSNGITALYSACVNNHIAVIEALLSVKDAQGNYKVDVNKSFLGETPLYSAIDDNRVEIVKLLLRVPGIDLNKKPKMSYSPLCLAIYKGYVEISKLLFFHGASDCQILDIASEGLNFTLVDFFAPYYKKDSKLKFAHTALKPYVAIEPYIQNKQSITTKFLDAYELFRMEHNPNDLHNLIFPINKKDGVYQFALYPGNSQLAYNLIVEELLKLFQKDRIKWLLFSLVDTKADKQFAMQLLATLDLDKQVQDEKAVRVLQKAGKGYMQRKNIS